MMGVLEAAQCLSMDVDGHTAVQGIFHSWILPWFQPGWAHGTGLCPEPHSEVAEHPPGFPCQGPSGRRILRVPQHPGGTESPESPGLAVPTCLGSQGRPGGLWLLSGVVGGLTLLIGLLQLQGFVAAALHLCWCPWWSRTSQCRHPQTLGTEELGVTNIALSRRV